MDPVSVEQTRRVVSSATLGQRSLSRIDPNICLKYQMFGVEVAVCLAWLDNNGFSSSQNQNPCTRHIL